MEKKFVGIIKNLDYLTVFRSLLDDPVITSLRKLAEYSGSIDIKKAENAPYIYGRAVAELYKRTSCITDYICTLVGEDENFYIRGVGAGQKLDPLLQNALENDLHILQELATLDCGEITAHLPHSDKAPRWEIHDINLLKFYNSRLSELKTTGYGVFAKYDAFLFDRRGLCPVPHPDTQQLSDLCGYGRERGIVLQNTAEFVSDRPANNLLLYGDAGTGKSATIKAIFNHYKSQGLRLIELKKENLVCLPSLLEELAGNPLKFILFIDDLSFNKNDDSFSSLKAVLEGSVAATGSNCIIYATSNRRHLVKENFSDREGDELHLGDTMQEVLSLSARFGMTITFQSPDRESYQEIVEHFAKKYGIDMPCEELFTRAEAFAIRSGGRSPRTAKHFVQSLSVAKNSEKD